MENALLEPRQQKKSLFKYFLDSKTSTSPLLTPAFKGDLHCACNLKKAQNILISSDIPSYLW